MVLMLYMNNYIADNLLLLHYNTFNHKLKMICIPQSKLHESIDNERNSITTENNFSGSNHGSSVPNKQYCHLLDEKSSHLDSPFPTPDSSISHKSCDSKQCCHVRRSTVLLHLYIPFYCMYLVAGAVMFSLIEGPIERNYTEELRDFRMKFLQRNTCVPDSELEELVVEIIRASSRGISASRNFTGELNWSFGQSFFFSSTVVTTIGYGHVHPLSEGGKGFCIIYSVFGIPMTFILITALVERLLVPTTWILHYMSSKLGHLYQPFNISVLHLLFIGTLAFVLFMVLPALLFTWLEKDWDFLNSLYCCFISLTTIGLGDYVPGDNQDQKYLPVYKFCITVYLILGLTAVMLLLHLYNDIPELNLGFFLLRRSDKALTKSGKMMSIQGQDGVTIPKYIQNDLHHPDQQAKVVSQSMDSPPPEDNSMPVHVQMPSIIPHNH